VRCSDEKHDADLTNAKVGENNHHRMNAMGLAEDFTSILSMCNHSKVKKDIRTMRLTDEIIRALRRVK
jgi:hypothetical protein